MYFLILGRSVGLEKKNHKKSWNRRPWYPGTTLKVNFHITGVTKCTICCKKCSCFFYHFYDHFSDRLKELFQMINGLTTLLLFFFLENAKNLGRSDDAKRRKIRGVALDKTSNWFRLSLTIFKKLLHFESFPNSEQLLFLHYIFFRFF